MLLPFKYAMATNLYVINQNFQRVRPELFNLFDVFPEQEGLISVGIINQFIVRHLIDIGKVQLTRDKVVDGKSIPLSLG